MVQIPDELITRPWSPAAKADLNGLPSASELRGPLWRRPHRGVRAWAGSDADDPRQRILAAAAAVDGAPLGGWAAAYLHGAKELDGETAGGEALPVLFCIGKSGTKRRRAGLEPFRSPMGIDDVVRIDGVLCTSLVRTTFDLLRLAPSLADAVADIDTMLRCTRLRLADLDDYVQQQRRVPGLVQAREALRLADPSSLSRPESKLRVLWVVDAGLPEPLVNVSVFDRRTGRRAGEPDLLDAKSGLAGEYDGDYHWELAQSTADNRRQQRLESLGLTVVRVTAIDMRDPEQLVARLREAYARAVRVKRRNWFILRSGRLVR
jgi:hypothetical protein